MTLTVEHVFKRFGGLQAIDDCSFTVEDRRVTGLVGPNGAGKTTLFNMITGTLGVDRGSIAYQGVEIVKLSAQERIERGIGRTFQDVRLFPDLTVEENVTVAMQHQPGDALFRVFFRPRNVIRAERANRRRARDILEFVGLSRAAWVARARDISYGEQKLVSLARLLATGAALLLLDEPASGLDETSLDHLKELVHALVADEGKTILIVEHNMLLVRELCDWIVFLANGQVFAQETAERIMDNPELQTRYLGIEGGQATSEPSSEAGS